MNLKRTILENKIRNIVKNVLRENRMNEGFGSYQYKGKAKPVSATIVKDFEKRYNAAIDAGSTIEITRTGEIYITINDGENEYQFKDHQAEELMNEIHKNIKPEVYLLVMAETSW